MINTTALAVFFTTLFISCAKEKEREDNFAFTGIRKTDIQGLLISEDTTDWRFNDIWIDK